MSTSSRARDSAAIRPACPAVRCPYSRASEASACAKVDSQTSMSAWSASSNAPSQSRVSMMNANRWPGLGSLTCSRLTRPCAARRRPSRCRRPISGPAIASRREPVRQHPPPVRLRQPVSEGGHAVGQPTASMLKEGAWLTVPSPPTGRSASRSASSLVQRRIAQPLEDLAVLGRVMGLDHVRHLVERQPLEYAGQAEAVIAVEMGDADAADLARRDPGELHLALRSLARIEQDSVGFPPEQVAVVVAATGRHLARSAENHEFPVGHGTDLTLAAGRRARDAAPASNRRNLLEGLTYISCH